MELLGAAQKPSLLSSFAMAQRARLIYLQLLATCLLLHEPAVAKLHPNDVNNELLHEPEESRQTSAVLADREDSSGGSATPTPSSTNATASYFRSTYRAVERARLRVTNAWTSAIGPRLGSSVSAATSFLRSHFAVNASTTALPHPPSVLAPLDVLCDFALGAVIHEEIVNRSTEQRVPDFKKQFHVRIGPVKVHGHLDASDGSAGDLSSLFRDGPVTLSRKSNGDLTLNAAVGLRTLRVHYKRYSARAGPIRVSGSLEVETSPAALRVELELQPPCSVRLGSLQVAALGPLNVRASGLGVLRPLLPLLDDWMDERMRSDVQSVVIPHLSTIISQHLSKISC